MVLSLYWARSGAGGRGGVEGNSVGRSAIPVGAGSSGGKVSIWVGSGMDGDVPDGDRPPDGDRQAVRMGIRMRNESKDLYQCMSRIVLSTRYFVNYAIF